MKIFVKKYSRSIFCFAEKKNNFTEFLQIIDYWETKNIYWYNK